MNYQINKDTRMCVSLSARPGNFGTRFHNYLFRNLGLDFIYKAFAVENIKEALNGVRALGIRGAAVSMPFKEVCMEYLDELDPASKDVGSVNTVLNEKGRLIGFNTDYSAVVELINRFEISNQFEFVVAGSGGMAKSVVCALKKLGFKKGTIMSRNEKSGIALATQCGYAWQKELTTRAPEFIVNTTPIGMAGGANSLDLPFRREIIESAKVVMDVVAIPVATPLVQVANQLGKKKITGLEVISTQAAAQFRLYTGVQPTQELIEKAIVYANN